jgi:hypothetical protein
MNEERFIQTYFHRYVEGGRFWFLGNFVVYWSDYGQTSSRSQWMVPGTWNGEDW